MIEIEKVNGTILKTNNYIISDGKLTVIIEASADINSVKKMLKGKSVSAILLTHGHWDHFETLNKYLQEFKSKVYLTKQAFEKINFKERTFKIDRNPNIDLNKKDVVLIEDGDVLNFGEMSFKIIKTKGHTDCSVSYLLNNNFLFSGDTLFKSAIGRHDLPTGSYQDLIESLNKVFKLEKTIKVYPGHGEETTISEEIKNNI